MPRRDRDQSQAGSSAPRWGKVEWIISSGLGTAILAGAIWVGSISAQVDTLKDTVGGLDNSVLSTRITATALEVRLGEFKTQQDRMESKVDQLLVRQYGATRSGPTQAINPE